MWDQPHGFIPLLLPARYVVYQPHGFIPLLSPASYYQVMSQCSSRASSPIIAPVVAGTPVAPLTLLAPIDPLTLVAPVVTPVAPGTIIAPIVPVIPVAPIVPIVPVAPIVPVVPVAPIISITMSDSESTTSGLYRGLPVLSCENFNEWKIQVNAYLTGVADHVRVISRRPNVATGVISDPVRPTVVAEAAKWDA